MSDHLTVLEQILAQVAEYDAYLERENIGPDDHYNRLHRLLRNTAQKEKEAAPVIDETTLFALFRELDQLTNWSVWRKLVDQFWGAGKGAYVRIDADEGYRVREIHVFDDQDNELEQAALGDLGAPEPVTDSIVELSRPATPLLAQLLPQLTAKFQEVNQ